MMTHYMSSTNVSPRWLTKPQEKIYTKLISELFRMAQGNALHIRPCELPGQIRTHAGRVGHNMHACIICKHA